ncbi:hypothetical protein AB182_07340 [Phytobacter ursingii]|uniref:Uncharacterized protein n=1 Tax=Phytobacter ursingii TaxID=1972431 RepID=A0AAC8QLU8_9ENTR|nr:hypothetical protein AB182_07340 [Phytobacter ursingii]
MRDECLLKIKRDRIRNCGREGILTRQLFQFALAVYFIIKQFLMLGMIFGDLLEFRIFFYVQATIANMPDMKALIIYETES